MIALFCIVYASFYFIVFGKGLVALTPRNMSIFVGIGVVFIGSVVFAWWTFAPTTKDGRVFQYIIQIVPNVAGPVIEVPVDPLEPLNKGDILFRIDPVPYQAAVDQVKGSIGQAQANLQLAEVQVARAEGLVSRSAGAQSELDTWNARKIEASASIESLQAQLSNAQWNLEQTVIRAPSDGFVVNLQVRPGVRVTSVPLAAPMTFISSDESFIVSSLSQSSARYVKVGDPVEVVFSTRPGEVYPGKVDRIILATGEAQLAPSGQVPVLSGLPITGRRPITVSLDDPEILHEVGQGAQSFVGFYTDRGKPFQVITKVAVRMQAWMGFLTNPAG